MVLDRTTAKKIEEFVFSRPRTVQEIAQLVGKNWRTAESYVERIAEENGTISLHTFRGGTKGALKLVYWNNIESPHGSAIQERLFRQIQLGRTKADFSPLDIYQFVPSSKREAFLERQQEGKEIKQDLLTPLRSAREKVLIFSGNLSWANLTQKGVRMIDVLEDLARAGVSVKFLATIDISTVRNWEKIEAVNERLGRDAIEVRHASHPVRAFVVDRRIARFKETYVPSAYEAGELARKTYVFYNIYDPEWIAWTEKVFWNLFSTAIPAAQRIENLKQIRGLSGF